MTDKTDDKRQAALDEVLAAIDHTGFPFEGSICGNDFMILTKETVDCIVQALSLPHPECESVTVVTESAFAEEYKFESSRDIARQIAEDYPNGIKVIPASGSGG